MKQTVEGFREPDAQHSDGSYALWYGPDGAEGDVATEVSNLYADLWIVSEYQHVGGLLEDYDPDFPFLVSSTTVQAHGPRIAAALGVEKLSEYGPDSGEEFDAALPVY